jgi:hypothetical protein
MVNAHGGRGPEGLTSAHARRQSEGQGEALISPALFSPCGEKREPIALRVGGVCEDERNPLSPHKGRKGEGG